jgi:hypothetical protein
VGNGWGCLSDLFPWVEVTIAAGSNGKAQPPGYTGEGATAMGFFNVQQGDAMVRPYNPRTVSTSAPLWCPLDSAATF